ncbi:MAG: hypothetical protein ABSG75_12610 [Syntrophales bacterium]|jgi:transposase-like protein
MSHIQSSNDQLIGDLEVKGLVTMTPARDKMPAQLECPSCHGTSLVKHGKSPGTCRQKYRCLNPGCRRQFVAGSDHLVDPEVKARVIEQLVKGIPPKKIAQDVSHEGLSQISMRWVYGLRTKIIEHMIAEYGALADHRTDQKIKDIILNMLSAGIKRSQIKKIIGDDISPRYISNLRRKKKGDQCLDRKSI